MTATDAQVRLLMKERNQGKTQEQAAVKANLRSRKTVAKYEKQGKLPSELKAPVATAPVRMPFQKFGMKCQ